MAGPLPAISKRNGISRPPTTTAASQRPAGDGACAVADVASEAATRTAARARRMKRDIDFSPAPLKGRPAKTKRPEGFHLRALKIGCVQRNESSALHELDGQ